MEAEKCVVPNASGSAGRLASDASDADARSATAMGANACATTARSIVSAVYSGASEQCVWLPGCSPSKKLGFRVLQPLLKKGVAGSADTSKLFLALPVMFIPGCT